MANERKLSEMKSDELVALNQELGQRADGIRARRKAIAAELRRRAAQPTAATSEPEVIAPGDTITIQAR